MKRAQIATRSVLASLSSDIAPSVGIPSPEPDSDVAQARAPVHRTGGTPVLRLLGTGGTDVLRHHTGIE
jgi:hypothetical protein